VNERAHALLDFHYFIDFSVKASRCFSALEIDYKKLTESVSNRLKQLNRKRLQDNDGQWEVDQEDRLLASFGRMKEENYSMEGRNERELSIVLIRLPLNYR